MTRVELRLALVKLRSGNRFEIIDGELMLMRAAGVGPSSGCSCPDFPQRRARTCFAHTYVEQSVIESRNTRETERRAYHGLVPLKVQA